MAGRKLKPQLKSHLQRCSRPNKLRLSYSSFSPFLYNCHNTVRDFWRSYILASEMKHGKKEIHLLTLISDSGKADFSSENLPTEIRVLKTGDNQTVKGVVRVGNQTRSLLPLNQKSLGFDRVALDFEHNTVPGTTANKESKEPRPVAAFGVPQLRPDGLWLCNLEWTPDGRKNARNYIDLSPAPSLDDNREVIFLHSVALCRQGAVNELSIFSVDLNINNSNLETDIMDKLLTALRKALNLADNADENAIAAAVAAQPATFTAEITKVNEKITTLTAAVETVSYTHLTLPTILRV